jgi:tetratricopeptide (TPR) repeat protein
MRAARAVLAAAIVLVAAPAAADDALVAESFFADGKALMAKGKTAAACAKFEASRALDPKAVGVLLNLGLCNEKLGKLATAWRQLREAAARSRATRPDRAKLADDKATALEARLSRVAVRLSPAARVAGLALTLDDAPLPEAAWDAELPVDGGAHVLRATAPGRVTRTLELVVRDEKDHAMFGLDALEELPPPPPVVASPPSVAPASARRTAGVALVVGGAAVAMAGGAFGVATLVEKGRLGDVCPAPCLAGSSAAAEADSTYSRANAYAWVADVAIPVGVASAAVGVFLLATGHDGAPTAGRLRVVPAVSPAARGASIAVGGAF